MDPPDMERWTAVREDAFVRVTSVQRLECVKRNANRFVISARRETEQRLLARLPQVGDRVVEHSHVADAAARERRCRTTERDQAPVLLEQLLIPGVAAIPRHRA